MDMMVIRNWLALKFIRFARKLTTWGFVDDHLAEAEKFQVGYNKEDTYYDHS
jgi:hypothetical protein